MKNKLLVFTVEVKVELKDLDGFSMERGLDAFREAGSAEVIDVRVEEVA